MNNIKYWIEVLNDTVELAFEKAKKSLDAQGQLVLIDQETLSSFRKNLDTTINSRTFNIEQFFYSKLASNLEISSLKTHLLQTEFVKHFILEIIKHQEYIDNCDFYLEIGDLRNSLRKYDFYKLKNSISEFDILIKNEDEVLNKLHQIALYKIEKIKNPDKNYEIQEIYKENFLSNISLTIERIWPEYSIATNMFKIKRIKFALDNLYNKSEILCDDEKKDLDIIIKKFNESLKDEEQLDFNSLKNLININKQSNADEDYISVNIEPAFFNLYMDTTRNAINDNNSLDRFWKDFKKAYSKNHAEFLQIGEDTFEFVLEGYGFTININRSIDLSYKKIIETTIADEFLNYIKECQKPEALSVLVGIKGKNDHENFATKFIDMIKNLLKEYTLIIKLEDTKIENKTMKKKKI